MNKRQKLIAKLFNVYVPLANKSSNTIIVKSNREYRKFKSNYTFISDEDIKKKLDRHRRLRDIQNKN